MKSRQSETVSMYLLFDTKIFRDNTYFVTSKESQELGLLSLELNAGGTAVLCYVPQLTYNTLLFRRLPVYYPLTLSDETQELLLEYGKQLE